jgi:hypothetical protein
MDTFIHHSEPASEASKSLSQRFDEMPDSASTTIEIITSGFWPTLPSTPASRLRILKNIPNNEIKSWLLGQNYPADYFHIQLVKAYRTQINSQLTLSAYIKKMTTGNNILFVLLLPLNALLLFPFLYRKKIFYYDAMIFTLHINTLIPFFHAVWIWVLALMMFLVHAPASIFLSIPVINGAYYFFALKRAFGFSWASTILRWLPAFIIDTVYHWVLALLYAAWFMN